MKLSNNEEGFTPIEIVIAVAIGLILFVGIGSFVYFGVMHKSFPTATNTATPLTNQQVKTQEGKLSKNHVTQFKTIWTAKGDIVANGTGVDSGYVVAETPGTKEVIARIPGQL